MNLTIPQVDLYPHNLETYHKIIEMWKTTDKVGAVQATGTGKTYLQLQCLYDYNDFPKAVLAPSNYILDQLLAKSDGLLNTQLLTYAKLSQMSLTEIEELNPFLIVLDEFHRCGADEWGKGVQALLTAFPSAKILGTSATPIRYLDGARNMADELFENNLAVNSNLTDAWARGILPYPKYVTALYTFAEEAESLQTKIANSSNDEESKKELTKRLDELKRNLDMSVGVPQIIRKHISSVGGKYLVFCKDKAHLKEMEPLVVNWFKRAGIGKKIESYRISHMESGNSEELQAFRDNNHSENVRLLFAIEMLNEGIHISDITGVILLRPTASPIIHFQQMGRAFSAGRTNEPLIFDLVNNVASIHSDDLRKEFKLSVEREIVRRKAAGIKDLHIPEFTIIDETHDVMAVFAQLEAELRDDWDSNLEKFKYYLEKHDGKYPIEGTRIGNWIRNMRSSIKGIGSYLMSQSRVDALNSINFIWNVSDERWESNFKKYAAIVRAIGHPKKEEDMGKWACYQRLSTTLLSQSKIDRLNSIGFVWNYYDEIWQRGYDALIKYKEQFGDCKVPQGYKIDGYNLGNWVYKKMERMRAGKLTQEQTELLSAIGLTCGNRLDESFQRYCELLLEYYEQSGNQSIPIAYTVDGNKLGLWAETRRKEFKNGFLSQKRIEALNNIGFIWDQSNASQPRDRDTKGRFKGEIDGQI